MSRLERYKKAKIIGPGVWYAGHLLCELAADTKDEEDFMIAYGYIKRIKLHFICKICRSHINEFALKNDAARFLEKKDAEGLANWWYDLHNNANEHAGNPKEPREDVKKFFRTEEGSCDLDCDKDEEKTDVTKPILRKEAPGTGLYSQVRGNFRNSFSGYIPITEYVNIKR